jgi:cyanoexosortase A
MKAPALWAELLNALPRRLWLALAALTVTAHCTMVLLTQENPSLALMTLLIWGGALLCIEDQLPALELRPSHWSLLGGGALLLAGLARTASVLHLDAITSLLPLWLGLALALLCRPLGGLRPWGASLLVLALLPLSGVIAPLLPDGPLSQLTARISQVMLLWFGVDAAAAGRELILAGGAVNIAGSCTGIDQIAQLVVIAAIFLLAFPLPSRSSRWWMFAAAPVVGLLGNAVRIALLALITTSRWPSKDWWFEFLHDANGSLLFSAISVSVFGWLYIAVLERQLQVRDGG